MVVFFTILLNFYEIEELSTSVITKNLNKTFYLNASYLNQDEKNFLLFTYAHPYQLPSLNYFQSLGKFKKFGLLFQNLNYLFYNENRWAFVYSGEIKNFSYGFSPNFYYFKIEKDFDFFFTYNLGFALDFEKLILLLSLNNLNKPKIRNEELSNKIIVGTDMKFIKNLNIAFFYLKTKGEDNYKIGFDFSLNDNLSFGQEFSFFPFIINFKLDFLFKKHLGLGYFLNFHSQLKETHLWTLYFQW